MHSMMNPNRLSRVVIFVACVAMSFIGLSVAEQREARADILLGADLNGAFQLGEVSSDSLGLGANFRLGWQEDFIPLLRLAPELQVNYMGFAIDQVSANATDTASSSRQQLLSGRVGARVGIDFLVGLSLYSHIGYGFIANQGGFDFNDNGLSFDAGAALDFTALPFINLGIHSAYNAIFPGSDPDADPINWLELGVHVEVAF